MDLGYHVLKNGFENSSALDTEAWIDRRVDVNLYVDISESGIIVEDYLDLELTDEYIQYFGDE